MFEGEQLTLSISPISGSPVAFYASFSEETAALQMVKFNIAPINVGGSYFPKHGYFRAPERGVYLFAVSVTFGPGPGMGQLVLGAQNRGAAQPLPLLWLSCRRAREHGLS